jgi:hypothetical protein
MIEKCKLCGRIVGGSIPSFLVTIWDREGYTEVGSFIFCATCKDALVTLSRHFISIRKELQKP